MKILDSVVLCTTMGAMSLEPFCLIRELTSFGQSSENWACFERFYLLNLRNSPPLLSLGVDFFLHPAITTLLTLGNCIWLETLSAFVSRGHPKQALWELRLLVNPVLSYYVFLTLFFILAHNCNMNKNDSTLLTFCSFQLFFLPLYTLFPATVHLNSSQWDVLWWRFWDEALCSIVVWKVKAAWGIMIRLQVTVLKRELWTGMLLFRSFWA